VLIVDDDPKIREMLTSILENEGYSVEAVSDGKEALKTCKKFPIDFAIIDIELPDIKGTQLLGILRDIRPKMTKIILTGHPTVENAVIALNEKADAYILKPFKPADLLGLIKKLLVEKENNYLNMLKEVEQAKGNTPTFKYNNPTRW
jgi:DNA-binding response OmpR family regulator